MTLLNRISAGHGEMLNFDTLGANKAKFAPYLARQNAELALAKAQAKPAPVMQDPNPPSTLGQPLQFAPASFAPVENSNAQLGGQPTLMQQIGDLLQQLRGLLDRL